MLIWLTKMLKIHVKKVQSEFEQYSLSKYYSHSTKERSQKQRKEGKEQASQGNQRSFVLSHIKQGDIMPAGKAGH